MTLDIAIRSERKEDHRAVEELTREAFWNLYVPGCDEHYLTHLLRDHPDFLPELDLVAELDGRIVGNIMYARAWLHAEDGREMEIAGFGPVCVHPDYQGRGVGSALIERTMAMAAKAGIPGLVILGDPRNYCRHGFKSSRDFLICDGNGEYPFGMLARELADGAFRFDRPWKFRYSAVYDLDPAAAAAFDAGFPPKEKRYKPSQELYSIGTRAYLKP